MLAVQTDLIFVFIPTCLSFDMHQIRELCQFSTKKHCQRQLISGIVISLSSTWNSSQCWWFVPREEFLCMCMCCMYPWAKQMLALCCHPLLLYKLQGLSHTRAFIQVLWLFKLGYVPAFSHFLCFCYKPFGCAVTMLFSHSLTGFVYITVLADNFLAHFSLLAACQTQLHLSALSVYLSFPVSPFLFHFCVSQKWTILHSFVTQQILDCHVCVFWVSVYLTCGCTMWCTYFDVSASAVEALDSSCKEVDSS